MDLCDLHCHSVFSDGTSTPEELVDLALAQGLKAIALTDHNTIAGLERFLRAARGKIEACGGCEFTTEINGQELHLLGLFLNPEKTVALEDVLEAQIKRKEQSNFDTINRLKQAGYPVSVEEFCGLFGSGIINRVHIARYLMQKGIISSISEAFSGLLSISSGYYQEIQKIDFFSMIPLIRESGGVSVWAHPLFHIDRKTCEDIAIKAKAYGLDGIETYYPTYSKEDTAFMLNLADRLGLYTSGGSDFHGSNKPDIHLGIGTGNLSVPYTCFEAMRANTICARETLTTRVF